MKTTAAIGFSICLMILATGCAGDKVAQQRGWVGGDFLVARRPSWTVAVDDPGVVPALPKELEGQQRTAIFVSQVFSNTPLAAADFRPGDLIIAVDRQPVEKLATFHRIIDGCKPGSTASFSIFHNGRAEDREVTIGRETYKNWHNFTVGIGLSSKLEVDLLPNPDFSLIALGYTRDRDRAELHSPRNEFLKEINDGDRQPANDGTAGIAGESWKTWLAIFSVGGYKSVLSQEIVEPGQASLPQN